MLNAAPLKPGFGVEIPDLDVRRIDPKTESALRNLIRSEGLVLFRRQSLDNDQLEVLAGRFGDRVESPFAKDRPPGNPSIIHVSNLKDESGREIGCLGTGEMDWHSDSYDHDTPFTLSVLYAALPAWEGGKTYWASTRHAYESLSAEDQEQIRDLEGTYEAPQAHGRSARRRILRTLFAKSVATASRAIFTRPLVITNPATGSKSLYISERTMGVKDMKDGGKAMRGRLLDHTIRTGRVHGRVLQTGDLVLYDNSQTIHRRDAFKGPRVLKAIRVRLSTKA